MITSITMRYTKPQKNKIRKAITAEDRIKMIPIYGPTQTRQYANGLKFISPSRAVAIASLLEKPHLVFLFIPELAKVKKAI